MFQTIPISPLPSQGGFLGLKLSPWKFQFRSTHSLIKKFGLNDLLPHDPPWVGYRIDIFWNHTLWPPSLLDTLNNTSESTKSTTLCGKVVFKLRYLF